MTTAGPSRWGKCPMADATGQYCVLAAGHAGPHNDGTSELRSWLARTSDSTVMRTYAGNDANVDFQREARVFSEFGFEPVSQSGTSVTHGPGALSIATLGILAFGRRTTSSSISVMFRRGSAQAQGAGASVIEQIRQLGELRDSGIITVAEFEAKKAELLARI